MNFSRLRDTRKGGDGYRGMGKGGTLCTEALVGATAERGYRKG